MIEGREESSNRTNDFQVSESPRWVGLAVVALAVVSLLGLGIGWNATTHAKSAEQTLASQGKSLQQSVDALSARLSQSEETNAQLQNNLTAVTDKLQMTQGELTSTRKQTSQIKNEYGKKIDSVQTELATKASSDDVKSLGGDVTGVKTDLESTKNSLNMTRGEFGTLIARNHDEIDELRRKGERDYYEFTLTGKGNRVKAGSVMLELRSTDTKKNQFTLALYADDMRMEKKNRSVDEPIYFYTRGTHAPSEIVINQVDKTKAVGYVSMPKAQGAGQATAASAAPASN
jgi:hypothetical protein